MIIHFYNVTIYANGNIKGDFIKMETKREKMETKREKFVRLVEARTNKIIDMLRLLGNYANKANYDYTDEDVQKIFTTLEKEMKISKSKFTSMTVEDEKFKL